MGIGLAGISDRIMKVLDEDLADDRLVLPTLPEIALRIRELERSDDSNVADFAAEIRKDPAIAARIVRIANSAAHRASRPVESLQGAITRLGISLTCSLASVMAMVQMFRARQPAVDRRLRQVWTHGQDVAAMAHVLAAHCTPLNPEQAMLGGLVHQIGMLPVLRLADEYPEFAAHPEALEQALAQLHPRIGGQVLRAWSFPAAMLDLPLLCNDPLRDHPGAADYADVVIVAGLQSAVGCRPAQPELDHQRIPAVHKLGINPGVDAIEVQGWGESFEESRAMLAAA